MSETIGKLVQQKYAEQEFHWVIENVFSLSKEVNARYESPAFELLEKQWHLTLYPNGETRKNSTDYIGLYVTRMDSHPPLCVSYIFSVDRSVCTPEEKIHHDTVVFNEDSERGVPQFLLKSRLLEKRTLLAPSDVLTINCHLSVCYPKEFERTDTLSRDIRKLMVNQRNSDVTIKVEGKAFQVHRNILGVRVPFFDAMFQHEMIEKETGIVTIPDCKAATFRKFLEYVYTGTVTLTAGNVFALYELADKYQVDELKKGCLKCIKNTLRLGTFYDAIAVAIRHNEEELIMAIARLLSKNMIKIMKTAKWQKFLKENPMLANELTLKALAIKEGKY